MRKKAINNWYDIGYDYYNHDDFVKMQMDFGREFKESDIYDDEFNDFIVDWIHDDIAEWTEGEMWGDCVNMFCGDVIDVDDCLDSNWYEINECSLSAEEQFIRGVLDALEVWIENK